MARGSANAFIRWAACAVSSVAFATLLPLTAALADPVPEEWAPVSWAPRDDGVFWGTPEITPAAGHELGPCEAGGHLAWSAAGEQYADLRWLRCPDAEAAASVIPLTMLGNLQFPAAVPYVFGKELDRAAYSADGTYIQRYWSQGRFYFAVARECSAGVDCVDATERYVRGLSELLDEPVNPLPVPSVEPQDPLSEYWPSDEAADWVLLEARALGEPDLVATECEDGGTGAWLGRDGSVAKVFWLQCVSPSVAFQIYYSKWGFGSDLTVLPDLGGILGPGVDQAGAFGPTDSSGQKTGIARSWVQGSSYVNVQRICNVVPFENCTEGSRRDALALAALFPGELQPDTRTNDALLWAGQFLIGIPLLTLLVLFLPRWIWSRTHQSGYATGPTSAAFAAVDHAANRARLGHMLRRSSLVALTLVGYFAGLFTIAPLNNPWLLAAWFFLAPFALTIVVAGLLRVAWRQGPLLRIASGPAGPSTVASFLGGLLRATARAVAAIALLGYVLCTLMLLLVRSQTRMTSAASINALIASGNPLSMAFAGLEWMVLQLDAIRGYGLLFLVVLVVPMTVAYLLDRAGQRFRRRALHSVLTVDTRPYFLYLRGFDEDDLRVPSSLTRRGFIELFTPFGRPRFEEVLVRYLSRFGPVIAISPRIQRLPDLGAAKHSFAEDEWQDRVREWVGGAQAVVMAATPAEVRPGLEWEIGYLAEKVDTPRLMLVVAPWPRSELDKRWRNFLEHTARWPLFAPLSARPMPSGVQVLTWTEEVGWRGYGARRRWDWTYAASILSAVQEAEPAWTLDRELEEASEEAG